MELSKVTGQVAASQIVTRDFDSLPRTGTIKSKARKLPPEFLLPTPIKLGWEVQPHPERWGGAGVCGLSPLPSSHLPTPLPILLGVLFTPAPHFLPLLPFSPAEGQPGVSAGKGMLPAEGRGRGGSRWWPKGRSRQERSGSAGGWQRCSSRVPREAPGRSPPRN